MRSSSLGFASEIVRPPVRAAEVEVATADPESGLCARCVPSGGYCGLSRSGALCVMLSTLLVAAGVGVGIVFALTE